MRRVFLSFLGTNDYLPCTYYRDQDEFAVQNVRFVQEATICLCCANWDSKDRILIFTTSDAYRKNWLNDGHVDHKTGQIAKRKGLKWRLAEIDLKCPVMRIDIPEGKSEGEIWDIFSIVFGVLEQGDKIVFDITHAFRSIPMLTVVVLNYAKVLKGVTLDKIYYGAFEVLGSIRGASQLPLEKRRAPILDLTAFDQLMDWTTAIDRFIGAGDGRSVHRLAIQNILPVMKHSKGQHQLAGQIKEMANTLIAFTNALTTCRGPELGEIGCRLKTTIEACKENDLIRPLQPLFGRISEQTASFQGKTIEDGMEAAKWCLQHNLVQQGVTILRELVFSYVVASIGEDPQNPYLRDIASQALTIVGRKLTDNEDQWHAPARDNKEMTRKLIEIYERDPQLVKSGDALGQLRNDMNHAGFGRQSKKVKDVDEFRKGLESAIVQMEASFSSGRSVPGD